MSGFWQRSRDAQRGATEESVRSAAREQLDGLVIDVDGRKLRLDAREAFDKKYSTVKVIDEASGERVGEIQLRLADHSRNPGNDWRGGEDTRTVSVVLNSADPTEGRWHGGDLRYGEEADAERIVDDVRTRIEEIVAGESWGEAEGGAVTVTASPRTPTEAEQGGSYGVDARDVAQGMDDNNGTEVVRSIDYLRRGRLEQGESRYFLIGETGDILNEHGISGKITIGTSAVNSHHNEDADHLDENDWVEVIEIINESVAITEYGDRGNSYRIYTIVEKNGKNICVGVDVNSVGRDVNITNIRTAFARDIANALNERLVYPHSRTELETAIRELSLRHNREVYPEQPSDGANVRNNSDIEAQIGENVDSEDTAKYRIREDEPPRKTGIGYKVFVLKDGKLYPPMVANPGGEATPVGVWLDADAAPVAGVTKTGRQQVKAGGKGTQGGSGKLAYRPGWHLGEIPYALQFNRVNPETGRCELFPANFVWTGCSIRQE